MKWPRLTVCISKEVKKSLSAKPCRETAPLSGPNETGSDRNHGFYTWKNWSERRFVSPCSVWFVCLSCSRSCVSAAVSGTAGCSSLSSFYRRAAAALGSHLLNFKPSPKVPPRCHWSLLRLSISGQIAVLNCRTFEGFLFFFFLFKVLESSQMDSARQTVLSVHQRIVDNGGMMLIIFPHVCYAFIAFSFCIPVSRVVVGQIFSVKGNLVLVCWMSGKMQMCSRARLHSDCSVVFATWLSEWAWHFLSCYCLVTIIFVIGIEEQQASKLTHQECLWRKLVA